MTKTLSTSATDEEVKPFSFARQMMNFAYSRSTDIDDPQNANPDWRAGYAVGRYTDTDSFDAINQEWIDRGEPRIKQQPSFTEWKIGYWSGRFTRIDERLSKSKSAPTAGQ